MKDIHDDAKLGDDIDIAIVGMAARLPGAADIYEFWRNLRDGVSSIRRLSEEEMRAAGVDPGLMHHRDYVPFAAPLEQFDHFDAEFCGLSPKDAAIMDPQHRQFLECAWEALENAGHVPSSFPGRVGVFGGCGMGSYFYFNVCSNPDLVENTGMFLLRHTGNDKDFMTTRASNVFDLTGPSVNLQTACSTSLVATHYACQSLLNGECDMALAGGVTIELPQGQGYLYKENEILSPDGACHAFDHRAQGTVFGSGVGVVVLRRLSDALADGDHIWAVIKGSAVNNDGKAKAGYLAPSVEGQAAAVSEALGVSGVAPETVDYVECHGTGTYLGDPIEVAALTQAFRERTEATGFCRIGSVKTNIGHLDTAAGVASLIKTALALHHKQIPPSLGYEAPNPAIAFDASPFVVNDRLSPWPDAGRPRRAGVNALGVGGTNAHVVLEEASQPAASEDSDWPFQILTLSARSKPALESYSEKLAAHLRENSQQPLADVAWTLKNGRHAFEQRKVVVADSHEDAAALLTSDDPRRVHLHTALDNPDVAFLFPGGGAQYAGMARDLYETEPVFAEWVDRGLTHLATLEDQDIRALWLPEPGKAAEADAALRRPSLQLPLIMIIEYALFQMWKSWGVEPAVLAGHSMGENTAACAAGVIGFEDCIGLVHLRGKLFDTVPEGAMLSVPLSAEALKPYLDGALDLGAVNGPALSVASGPLPDIVRLEATLRKDEIETQRIAINIAAHSQMLDPILGEFRRYLSSIPLHAPQIPLTSNLSGGWLTDAEAQDPEYWVAHLRGTVRFSDCLDTLADEPNRIFLEVGPGKALSALARQNPAIATQQVLSSLRHPEEEIEDDRYMLETLGRIWALGGDFDWDQIWGDASRARVPLPTYAFQRSRYFISPGKGSDQETTRYLTKIPEMEDWGWRPAWVSRCAEVEIEADGTTDDAEKLNWLVFCDDAGLATASVTRLRAAGYGVVEVHVGDSFARLSDGNYVLAPERGREGYDQLMRDLMSRGIAPNRIAHFWNVTADTSHRPGSSFFHRVQEQGFYSLLFLSQALVEEELPRPIHVCAFTNDAVSVRGEPIAHPEKAIIAGPARVIPNEIEGVSVTTIDVAFPRKPGGGLIGRRAGAAHYKRQIETLNDLVFEELLATPSNAIAALRDGKRYEQRMKKVPLAKEDSVTPEPGATYLITGGLGGMGISLARRMAGDGCNLILVKRTSLPDRDAWQTYLDRHAPSDRVAQGIKAVMDLEASGATVCLETADVSNLAEMQAVVARAQDRFGRITGVIHAAGTMDDGPLLSKTTASVEQVFAPKIHGTQVLDRLFPDGSTDWIALFSSTSTVIGPAGQVDYVAANEFLNAFAASRRGGTTRVFAVDWGIWSNAGMAHDALARRRGDFDPAPETDAGVPLLEKASFDPAGNRVFSTKFSEKDWIIDEHRTKRGDALFPGAGHVSLAAQALAAHGETSAFELQDLTFLRPLYVPPRATRGVRVRLSRNDEGYQLDVLGDCMLNGRKGFAPVATAGIALWSFQPPEKLKIAEIRRRCGAAKTARSGRKLAAAQECQMDFGPRWKVLDSTAFGSGEGIADLSLGDAARTDKGWIVHPALFDIATGWAMSLIAGYKGQRLWVPVSCAAVRVYHPLPQRVVSWVRAVGNHTAESQSAHFDVVLAEPDGTVCMEIRDFTLHRLEDVATLAAPVKVDAGEFEPEDFARAVQPLTPMEERLQHNLLQGITTDEGAEAFWRALARPESQIVVSSLDLEGLKQQAQDVSGAETEGQKFDRPALEADYVEPETDIERTLAGFWEDLLGVQNVGAEDSFFDLGGHSLNAVRLFGKIRKAYQVDFPISVLFEAPTVRSCAALIEQGIGPRSPSTQGMEHRKTPERRFKYLVPTHEGEGGSKTPFFLVAGMFGNVLNLRHVAQLVGTDRPFFCLQAKGLFGGETPHQSIPDAARDYIAEMKQVQPHGPYMVGGFSGGGITAYEIVHQLETMGDEVALLVLLDTPLPQRRPLVFRDRLLIQLQEARRKGLSYPFVWARNRIRWELEKRSGSTADPVQEHSFHNAEIEAAFLSSVARYEMKPWQGRVVLFRPPLVGTWKVSQGRWVNHERAYLFDDNDWGQFTPNMAVREVPGDHDSMVLEPNVRVLAALMREEIVSADARIKGHGEVLPFDRVVAAE